MGNVDSAQKELLHNVIDKVDCKLRKKAHTSKHIPFSDDCNQYHTDYIDILSKYALDKDCLEELKNNDMSNIRYSKTCANQMLDFIKDDHTFVANCYEVVAQKLKANNKYMLFNNAKNHGILCDNILSSYQKAAAKAVSDIEQETSTQCILPRKSIENELVKNKSLIKLCTIFSEQDIYLCNFPDSNSSCSEILKKSYDIEVECNLKNPPTCQLKK